MLQNYITPIIEFIGLIIEYIGITIVIAAIIIALVKLCYKAYTMEYIRHHLAKKIMFGLEFIIVADILIVTVAKDFSEILQLGGIVVIRVLLGYTLNKEAVGK